MISNVCPGLGFIQKALVKAFYGKIQHKLFAVVEWTSAECPHQLKFTWHFEWIALPYPVTHATGHGGTLQSACPRMSSWNGMNLQEASEVCAFAEASHCKAQSKQATLGSMPPRQVSQAWWHQIYPAFILLIRLWGSFTRCWNVM